MTAARRNALGKEKNYLNYDELKMHTGNYLLFQLHCAVNL